MHLSKKDIKRNIYQKVTQPKLPTVHSGDPYEKMIKLQWYTSAPAAAVG